MPSKDVNVAKSKPKGFEIEYVCCVFESCVDCVINEQNGLFVQRCVQEWEQVCKDSRRRRTTTDGRLSCRRLIRSQLALDEGRGLLTVRVAKGYTTGSPRAKGYPTGSPRSNLTTEHTLH